MTASRAVVAGAVLWACVSAASAAVVADSEPQALDVPTGQPASVLAGAPLTHVVMFATWCEACVEELPLLVDLAARWEDDGYRVVFVAVQARQTRDRLLRFEKQYRLPGRFLMDVSGTVRAMLDVEVVPTHVLLDSRGREVYRATALDDGLRTAIAVELEGSAMSVKRRVGLVFGGRSVEHEVSVVSARGILGGFDADRVEPIALGVTRDGRWLSPALSGRILRDGRDAVRVEADEDDGARVVGDPGGGGLLVSSADGATRAIELDAVFPIIHGWGGEDGRIQGVLELAGVPYVGAGVAGSAVAMDKELARRVLAQRGVPMADWRAVTAERWLREPDAVVAEIADALGFPVFVKPANGGSSLGIARVTGADGLPAAMDGALAHDRKVIIERGIDAREIEVAVLGNERPEPSIPGEIVPGADFYTYEDKYRDGVARLLIPAPLDPGEAARVRDLAVEAFVGLDLEGMARVDFLVERGTGAVLFNEANTLPGFTPISMYPKLWEATGMSYATLLDGLVDLAIERFERDDARRAR